MTRFVAFFCVVLFALSSFGLSEAGFSKERLAKARSVLNGLVEKGDIVGGVVLVLRDGKPAFEHVFGLRDREAKQKMERDTIFRIASQTKAVTSAAALILLEEGKLSLNDPVSRFIPSFAKTKVRAPSGDIVDAKRSITIQDLMTHTSGIPYGMKPELAPLYQKNKLSLFNARGEFVLPLVGDNTEVCEAMERLATLPFESQPGEAFVYGLNTDVLGCVIERASGMPLDRFMRDRIFVPLKMKDTEFFLDKSKTSRLAAVYMDDADGKIIRGPSGEFVDGPRKSFSGGGGLLSTAQDYARFLEMIRRGGELDGVRILSQHTVDLMRTNQIGSLLGGGTGFGLGLEVVERYGAAGLKSVGSLGWSGAYGSTYSIDPKERLTIVFMVQQLPYPKMARVKDLVVTQVYQALEGVSH